MKELHALVDLENVQPTFEELAKLAPGFTDVWLFHGPHQVKQAQQFATGHDRVMLVPRSGKGPNALDFHLSFYLGYVAAKHPDAQLVVVANDKGYDPMIAHAKVLGFAVKRVGFKATKVPALKKVIPAKVPAVAKIAAPAAKPASAKKPVTAKTPVPAKKAPAKKVAAKKTPAKTVPAAKAVAIGSPTRKPAAKAPVPAKKAASPKLAPATTAAKEFARIKMALAKMGDKAPHKLKPLLRALQSMLGEGGSAEALDAIVQKLEQQGVVRVAGNLVVYG